MKIIVISLFAAVLVAVNCKHTFVGTNVMRPLADHIEVKYSGKILQKRIEFFNYTLPSKHGRYIQGILAYDLTNSAASANVTEGGIGTNFLKLRMKSDSGKPLKFDIYIYA